MRIYKWLERGGCGFFAMPFGWFDGVNILHFICLQHASAAWLCACSNPQQGSKTATQEK
jgi:hypothetical protein